METLAAGSVNNALDGARFLGKPMMFTERPFPSGPKLFSQIFQKAGLWCSNNNDSNCNWLADSLEGVLRHLFQLGPLPTSHMISN